MALVQFNGLSILDIYMNIIGINIGGGTNVFNKFVYGAMVPSELILEFLDENNFVVKQ